MLNVYFLSLVPIVCALYESKIAYLMRMKGLTPVSMSNQKPPLFPILKEPLLVLEDA